jgi:hypothetical protein
MLIVVLLTACDTEKDGMIVTDQNTGKLYLLKHNVGDSYFIFESKMLISGKDTTFVFK